MLARNIRFREQSQRRRICDPEWGVGSALPGTDAGGPPPMINKIIDFSDKNRFLVFLFVAAAILLGWNSMRNTKLDAIPDLSDTQVIVYAKWDRSPDIMEDQVTYPITSALLGMPKGKE